MVDQPEQVTQARALLERVAAQVGADRVPPLGSMIETPGAAHNAPAIAERSDLLSIGTNDLTASTLGLNKFAANAARSDHSLVLRSIAASVLAAHEAGISIEVCGEAASDPIMLPLLVDTDRIMARGAARQLSSAVAEAARGISRELGASRWPALSPLG